MSIDESRIQIGIRHLIEYDSNSSATAYEIFDNSDGILLRSQPYMHVTDSHDLSISIVGGEFLRDSELVFLIWTPDPAIRRTSEKR